MRKRLQHLSGGLTLRPLLALALLFVLLLEFGYHARVHVPGLRDGALLVLLYTGQQHQRLGSAAANHKISRHSGRFVWVFFFVVVFFFFSFFFSLTRRERDASYKRVNVNHVTETQRHLASCHTHHQLYETISHWAFKASLFGLMDTEMFP